MQPIPLKLQYPDPIINELKRISTRTTFAYIQYSPGVAVFSEEVPGKADQQLGFTSINTIKIEGLCPKDLIPFVLRYNIVNIKPGDIITRHKDKTRTCSLYFPILPEKNYSPLCFEDSEIHNDGKIWLIDHEEWHWVDNSKGTDRYNLQIGFSKTADEMKEILNGMGLI